MQNIVPHAKRAMNKLISIPFLALTVLGQVGFAGEQDKFDSLEMPSVLTNIGSIYSGMNETEKALEYHKYSIRLSQEIGENLQTAKTKHNMANIYLQKNMIDTAEAYYRDFFELSRTTGYTAHSV